MEKILLSGVALAITQKNIVNFAKQLKKMLKQIELIIETPNGTPLMAVIDYELTKTPFENNAGEVGAIILDAEIIHIELYRENGLKSAMNLSSDARKEIIKTILEYHDELEIQLKQEYGHPSLCGNPSL